MSKTCVLIFVFAFVNLPTALSVEAKEENHLLILDEANFNQVVNSRDILLVAFNIPDCQHCSELQARLSGAAERLKRQDKPPGDIAIGTVDAAAQPALAAQHGLNPAAASDFPALKLFSGMPPPVDYSGPRDTAEAIAAHLLASVGPRRLTEGNLAGALAKYRTLLVAFVDSATESDALAVLREAAEELRSSGVAVGFADARGEAAMAERLGVRTDQLPAFALLRQGQDWAVPYSHVPSAANLTKFCRAHGTDASAGARVFASLLEIDSVGEGLDALLLAGASARPEVRRFLANFLAESGHFFDRRLEGGLVSDGLAGRLGLDSPDHIFVRLAPNLLTGGEPQVSRYPGPLDSAPALKTFFEKRSLPRFGLLAWNTYRAYMGAGRPVCIFYASLSGWRGEDGQEARDKHARLARLVAGRDGALFAVADESWDSKESVRFGFDESSADVNLGCYDATRRRFSMPESDGPDPDDVRRFLDAFDAGTLSPRIRSTAVPAAAGHLVPEVNAVSLGRLRADSRQPVLLIQCDFENQPCPHSLTEFDAAAVAAAASPTLGGIRFAKMNTRYNDAPGDLHYGYEGEAAIDMAAAQPQVALLLSGQPAPIRYQRDVVAKDYLLQFLAASLAPSGKQEL